jgi:hypothetical protein
LVRSAISRTRARPRWKKLRRPIQVVLQEHSMELWVITPDAAMVQTT